MEYRGQFVPSLLSVCHQRFVEMMEKMFGRGETSFFGTIDLSQCVRILKTADDLK